MRFHTEQERDAYVAGVTQVNAAYSVSKWEEQVEDGTWYHAEANGFLVSPWQRYTFALIMLLASFTTEYFLVAEWRHVIHVSHFWFWLPFFILTDINNGMLCRKFATGRWK